ncbi:MAG: sulfate ABC transporter ATP-binding protein [Methylococcaceae bacterium]|jgi:sulfate transport system ATP-binding protein
MSIQLSNLYKSFGTFSALDNIQLEIPEGELVALLGPSGCGKTTLLRIIAGLEQPDRGRVIINGLDKTDEHASHRGIGFVFQHYALFRHLNVFENIAFGLRVKPKRSRLNEAAIAKKVHALLDLVQLDWLHKRFPDQLSGGQRQRIALARALAVEPSVLLLDEPFGALDASVRKDLRQWLRNLHKNLNVTSIFVTHDQEEAMEVASQVVVLNKGRVEQQGAPSQLYDYPANAFVSEFIGQANIFHLQDSDNLWLKSVGLSPVNRPGIVAHVRPHHIGIKKSTGRSDAALTLKDWQHLGAYTRVELTNSPLYGASKNVFADVPSDHFNALSLRKGDAIEVNIKQAQWFN